MPDSKKPRYGITRAEWTALTLYGKFEQIIAWLLTGMISLLIIVTMLRLAVTLFQVIFAIAMKPLEPQAFQAVFGMIMLVLIAMEFNHTILHTSGRGRAIVKIKTVLLVALLAISRHFIIIDLNEEPAISIIAWSVSAVALGVVYWLIRERDDRAEAQARKEARD